VLIFGFLSLLLIVMEMYEDRDVSFIAAAFLLL